MNKRFIMVKNEGTGQCVGVYIDIASSKPTTHAILQAFRQGFNAQGEKVTYWDSEGNEVKGNC